jgi:hypothetical protein
MQLEEAAMRGEIERDGRIELSIENCNCAAAAAVALAVCSTHKEQVSSFQQHSILQRTAKMRWKLSSKSIAELTFLWFLKTFY